ncbi:hypothetical protein LXJ56_24460, partial [Escherichia coli]|nr:hypothetical protein [Escherichia coli]
MSIRMRYAASAATLSLGRVTGARAQTVNPKEAANPTKAAPLSEAYPVEGVGDGVTAGGYNQSRWVEDWT